MKLKKIFSFVTSTSLCASFLLSTVSLSASAATVNIVLGDVNSDGLSPMDALYVQEYLVGNISVTEKQLTAMDYNEDGIIDYADVRGIMYSVGHSLPSQHRTKETYSLPDNSSRSYYKHNCNSTNSMNFTSYSISATSSTINSVNDIPSLMSYTPDAVDNVNTGCVKLRMVDFNGNHYVGSGFIVDDNVIATAAHCLFDSTGFMKKVTVELYDDINNDGDEELVYSVDASSIHIPQDYPHFDNNGNYSYNVNYDYGLIYVDDFLDEGYWTDFSEYKVNLGVMTDYYLNPTSQNNAGVLSTTGYPGNRNGRYYSSGSVVSMFNSYTSEAPYRFHTLADCPGGKSGGMTYNTKNVYSVNYSSAVGINTHSYAGSDTFGMRLNPTLLRFYFHNPLI